ncbi:translational activator of cytochrome c oxidase 1 [Danio rerio]|uniref:Translational activator of cytochrome c oxidase 1 n=1 Tax=Danio rerio TaxID=7955 RepID=F1QP29_DANRE|nr:translational activator of cytochrome c oxidase 1 [Danio rerio]|eukprot:NP_001076342.2 translational activator of cytochrome c oxidase 1 [Danio rerio]
MILKQRQHDILTKVVCFGVKHTAHVPGERRGMLVNIMLRAFRLSRRASAVFQCPVLHPCRALHSSPVSWAGHNKWSKVKDIKIPKDAARARVIAKYTMMIRIAVREGGPNPELNVGLAQILEQCRNKNLPKTTIEGALKGAKSKPGVQYLYEATGPGGCKILIEVLTDNNMRSLNEVKRIMTKNGGALREGARRNFDRKGVVAASRDGISSEKALELAIEAGAEDVQEMEDEEDRPILQFICDMTSMKAVRSALESLGVHTLSSSLEFVSHTPSLLTQTQLETASTLLEALHDCPDVVRVWDNIHAQT